MKQLCKKFLVLVVVAFLSSCQKDPPINPEPTPKPKPNRTVEIKVDFSSMAPGLSIALIKDINILDSTKKKGIMSVPLVLPITTFRLTGEEAERIIGKKIYIYLDGCRYYVFQITAPIFIIKVINPVLPLPAINTVVISIPPEIDGPFYDEDP